jgi:hypothetical protein
VCFGLGLWMRACVGFYSDEFAANESGSRWLRWVTVGVLVASVSRQWLGADVG